MSEQYEVNLEAKIEVYYNIGTDSMLGRMVFNKADKEQTVWFSDPNLIKDIQKASRELLENNASA